MSLTVIRGREIACIDILRQRWVGGSFDGRGQEVLYTRREMPADAPWNFSLEDVPAGEPASRYVMMAQNEQR